MRIGTLAEQLGTTPHAIHFYERRGLQKTRPMLTILFVVGSSSAAGRLKPSGRSVGG